MSGPRGGSGRPLPRTVAIDGPAGSGKSTVAELLAARLGAERLDTGAMYRAVAWSALRRNVDPADTEAVAELARSIAISVGATVVVDGVDATDAIRTPEVDAAVSVVAANPAVRRELVARQRQWVAERATSVVEGRDIGTVVLPDADVKVYLTASVAERARRRSTQRGQGERHDVVAAQLVRRDDLDSTRPDSPLPRPEDVAGDAYVVDSTDRDPASIVDEVLARWDAARGGAMPSEHTTGAETEDDPAASHTAPASDPAASDPAASDTVPAAKRGRPPGGPSGLGVSDGVYRFLRRLAHGVNRSYWRVTVEGAGQVPDTGPVILAPVHRSFVDFFVVSEVTRRKVFYMTKEEMWRSPRLGAVIASLGGFPVNRSGADREALERAQAVLERGDVLILFPEGTRRRGPDVTDIHEGATFLAARTGAVVVPIGVGGTDRVMPLGSRLPRPAKVHLVVGEPLVPPARSAGGRVPRSQVRTMTEALQAELQRCYDRARGAG